MVVFFTSDEMGHRDLSVNSAITKTPFSKPSYQDPLLITTSTSHTSISLEINQRQKPSFGRHRRPPESKPLELQGSPVSMSYIQRFAKVA